jgi:hypothetical protein
MATFVSITRLHNRGKELKTSMLQFFRGPPNGLCFTSFICQKDGGLVRRFRMAKSRRQQRRNQIPTVFARQQTRGSPRHDAVKKDEDFSRFGFFLAFSSVMKNKGCFPHSRHLGMFVRWMTLQRRKKVKYE